VTLAGVASSRFCTPKRKMLGVSGLRSTPGTPRTAANIADMQPPKTESPKRSSNASDAVIPRRQTNTPHATSSGPDWPFRPKRHEKKPAASSRRRSHAKSMPRHDTTPTRPTSGARRITAAIK
jgi:hypothetical protein